VINYSEKRTIFLDAVKMQTIKKLMFLEKRKKATVITVPASDGVHPMPILMF